MGKSRFEDIVKVVKKGVGGVSAGTSAAAALLGADLVVVALAWDNPPSQGSIVTITFLMMISFIAFINVLHHSMRVEYIMSRSQLEDISEDVGELDTQELLKISKWTRIMHLSGFIFTMKAFWIISYKYLISLAGYHLVILLLPFILFVIYWIPKFAGIEREVTIFSMESILQLIVQIIFLVLICLDFFKILIIP